MNTSVLRNKVNAFLNSDVLANKKFFLPVGIAFILVWQSFFWVPHINFNPEYGRKDATGFNHLWGKNFLYFYYYLGYFPLASTYELKEFSTNGAEKIITEKANTLLMEWKHWARFGDRARIWLFMPDALFNRSPEIPSIRLFNGIFFNITLLAVFIFFWHIRKPLFGLLLTLIAGSSPFLLYEIYNNQNIFGILSINALLLLAIHLPLFANKFNNKIFLIPLITGIDLAFFYNIRSESLPLIISCLLIYFFTAYIGFAKKIILSSVLILSFFAVHKSINLYFDKVYNETFDVVEKNGGYPFTGGKTITHPFWHPVFCGLGDFDTKYGYQWQKETVAYKYAIDILQKKYDHKLIYPGNSEFEMGEYYDSLKLYYKKPETLPGYDEVIKQKVLTDIKNDPLWYAEIILKRVNYIFSHTSPINFRFYKWDVHIPFSGYFLIPFLLFFIFIKNWFYVKLLLFTLPVVSSSLIITSLGNNSYNSSFHFILFALILYAIAELILKIKK